MKRSLEKSIELPTKKIRPNSKRPWHYLPADVWGEITGHLDSSQGLTLITTSSFFYREFHNHFKQPFFLEFIQKHIFDYSHQSELTNFIDLPVGQIGLNKLQNLFASKFQAKFPEILDLQFHLDFSSHLELEESDYPFEPGHTDIDVFLEIIGTAVREGNILMLKELENSLPVYMEHCINDVNKLGMTPFAYAAAFDRENICLEILSHCDEPFKPVVNYDLGEVFSMRSIHIFALRSNKNFLLTILTVYFDSLDDVFEKDFEDALWDILHNQVESLEAKLDENESLLRVTDEESWTLVQWASCFPDAIDCLRLLIDKGAVLNGQKSPPVAYIACAAGNLLALQTLIAKGKSIEPLENGNSLLHLSVYLGHEQITKELVENYKHNVNISNYRGVTPLELGRYTDRYGVDLSPEKLAKKQICVEILLNNNAEETYVPGQDDVGNRR